MKHGDFHHYDHKVGNILIDNMGWNGIARKAFVNFKETVKLHSNRVKKAETEIIKV